LKLSEGQHATTMPLALCSSGHGVPARMAMLQPCGPKLHRAAAPARCGNLCRARSCRVGPMYGMRLAMPGLALNLSHSWLSSCQPLPSVGTQLGYRREASGRRRPRQKLDMRPENKTIDGMVCC